MSKRKKLTIAGGGILVLAVIVFFSINATRKDAISVQMAKAERRDTLTAKVSASGEIRAKEFVDLQSEVAGIITELPVHEGDRVEKGAVLLKIDPIQTAADTTSARAQHQAAVAEARAQEFQILNAESGLARDEASLNSARAELEQAQSNFTRSQSSFARKQQLHEDGLISREEYEMAQNEARASKSQLEVAKARITQMQTQVDIARNNIQQMKTSQGASLSRAKSVEANLTRAQDQLNKTTLYAPLSGVITQLLVEKGERAVPGIMSNPQATLMTIADLSTIQAELKVDETDVVNVAIGNRAYIKVDALPDVSMEGEVTEVGNSPINSAAAAQQQEAKDFKVIVTIKKPSPKLRPGMSCTGDILTDTRRNVLVVPIQALTIREVEVDASGKYHEPELGKTANKENKETPSEGRNPKANKKELEGLFVIKDRVARFRPVKAGIAGESEIEIKEGLKDGEEVVSGSFQTLRTIKDGASVKIDKNVKKQENKT